MPTQQPRPGKIHGRGLVQPPISRNLSACYIRKTRDYIDIYHYVIDPEKKMIRFILSNGDCMFLTERLEDPGEKIYGADSRIRSFSFEPRRF